MTRQPAWRAAACRHDFSAEWRPEICATRALALARQRGHAMIDSTAEQVHADVRADYEAAAGQLDPRTREWLRAHLIPPRPIELDRKTDGNNTEQFWLITDHTGREDASFRVVFDDALRRYGIECTILNNISLFAGFRASLVDAVSDIRT
jgi:hypothetical protein